MTAFSDAIDDIFGDGDFVVAAKYMPPGGGAGVPCSVITDMRDRDLSGFMGQPTLQGNTIEVRKSEVPAPARGGTFTLGEIVNGVFVPGPVLTVASDPKSTDPDRLVWTMTVT